MSTKYRYQLDKSSKKHICPDCCKIRFVRYIDTEKNEFLPEKYGRCDREGNCNYHLSPYSDGYNTYEGKENQNTPQPKLMPQPIYFIPEIILNATLKNYNQNIFIQNLLKLAPAKEIESIISLYRIGTIGKGERAGAVTFPFIDRSGNIRTIQAKQFNETNHTTSTDFVHSIITRHYSNKGQVFPGWLRDYSKNEKFVSCLFGEHLLNKYPNNPIALVEAPKTAIIASLYYGLPETPDDLLWIAVYNKSSLSFEKCRVLKGRKVVLFPDLNAFNDWSTKSQELNTKLFGTQFVVSDLLEKNANENDKKQGLDLADYLTQFDYKALRKQTKQSVYSSPQSCPQLTTSRDAVKITQHIQSEITIMPANNNSIVELSIQENIRRDYIGDDGILHIYYQGIPQLN
jgi:hypothetical protein